MIHQSSLIHESSTIGQGVEIGPFCIVGPLVQIGNGTKLLANVTIVGHTTIGQRCTIFPQATIGAVAQHGLWKGGDEARVLIGDDCIIRENVTIHRSTHGLDRPTKVGNRVLLMTSVHVAHDCIVGDDAILVTGVGIAGHATIGRKAIVAGMSAVTQGVTVGEHAFVAAGSVVTRDVLPFSLVKGDRARTMGVNVVGLRRLGWEDAKIRTLQSAVAIILYDGVDTLKKTLDITDSREAIQSVIDFFERSRKGICVRPGSQSLTILNKL